jgi:capsule polysaccharide export protein KpsE/RkpR
MSDEEKDKENLVLKNLEKIQAELASMRNDVADVRGAQQDLKDTMYACFSGVNSDLTKIQARLTDVRDIAVKALAEVVAIAKRLGAVEKRLDVIEAPKH